MSVRKRNNISNMDLWGDNYFDCLVGGNAEYRSPGIFFIPSLSNDHTEMQKVINTVRP